MMKILIFCLFFTPIIYGVIPQKVVICGVCKDCAGRLPYSIRIMEKIGSLFSDYHIIVYENNSTDSTPQILKNWSKSNQRVFTISENIEKNVLKTLFVNYPMKTEAIARARNIVLDIATSERYQEFKYLIMMDMDFKIAPSYEGFIEIFKTKQRWDAIFAYGVDPRGSHWDWFAFRDDQCPLGAELLGDYWWTLPYKFFNLKLTTESQWYPVYSAFGGCGIYKKSSIVGCRYSGLVTNDLATLYHQIIITKPKNKIVQQYLFSLRNLRQTIFIENPSPVLSAIHDSNIGIITNNLPKNIVWRINSEAYKYPALADHVPFHASMIVRGHNQLFINPRLVFHYSS